MASPRPMGCDAAYPGVMPGIVVSFTCPSRWTFCSTLTPARGGFLPLGAPFRYRVNARVRGFRYEANDAGAAVE